VPWRGASVDCERMCRKRVELETEILGDSSVSYEECLRECMSASA
jgi:hypothetical protein